MRTRSQAGVAAAAKTMLRNHLGPSWPGWLLALAFVTLAPALWFHKEVGFAPERFVEEWVKLITTTLMVAVVVEVIVAHREREEAIADAEEALRTDYVLRLDRIARNLTAFRDLQPNDLASQDPLRAALHRDWQEFSDRYHSEFVLSTPRHLDDKRVERIRLNNYSLSSHLIDSAITALEPLRISRCDDAIESVKNIRTAFIDDHENSAN